MSVTLTGTGGLFTRLGKIGKFLNDLNSYRGSTTVGPDVDAIGGQYQSTRQDLVDQLYSQRDAYRAVHSSQTTALRTLATNTIVAMFDDDSPLVDKTPRGAMTKLIAQLTGSGDSVNHSVVSVTVTAGSGNTGNCTVVASLVNGLGVTMEYPLAESSVLTITNDADSGATSRQEPYSLKGVSAQSDKLSWDWPKGSAASLTGSVVDPGVDNGLNILTNSDWESITSNKPDNWDILVGSAGTSILDGTSSAYRGSHVLKFVGDGAEFTSISQTFNSSSGTLGSLLPKTVYALNCFVKVSAVPAAGVLEISLVDGSNAIINNAAGAQNKVTLNLTGATTSYVPLNGFFQTPANVPDTYKVRVRLSTPLESGKSVFVDDLALTRAGQLYAGGPFVAAFSASTDPITGDYWTVAVTNTYGAFQKFFERMFSMRDLGLQLPSSASPTIADSLLS